MDDNPTGIIQNKNNMDYLTVPLLLRTTFGKELNYFVNAEPYVGFLIRHKMHHEAYQYFQETNLDYSKYNKRTDKVLSFGLGFSYTLKEKFAFSFEAINNQGLTNTSNIPFYNNGPLKTNVLNLIFDFSYKLGQHVSEMKK